jgi:putative membrane-bound dehydrogenase-like protein
MKSCMKLAGLALPLILLGAATGQVGPAKALSTFKVSEGLELTLWASEPLFSNPTCMDVDHKGRVWVCESINYRNKLKNQALRRPAGDRILILEDTTGKGQADKVTVFYQSPEILAPLGIAVLPHLGGPGCTVYVCQSPDILVFEDKDGDGKADGPPRKLLSGFKGIDHDHGVHGILVGPDNKLYFSVGDQGVQNLPGKGGRNWTSNGTDCRAGTIWRCDLDGQNLELIAHNFRNEYEPCVDSFGTVFVSDNDDDGNDQCRICYVMPGGNYGYHPRGKGQTHWHEEQPGVVPMLLRTFRGSPTGMCFYEGTLLPEKYRGQPLHVDAGPGRLSCYHLASAGASYAIDREDMMLSSDPWFRPSDVCVGPAGDLFVADWYDPGVGGHGIRDFDRGRIYRLVPTGARPVIPTIDLSTIDGTRAALSSPNLAVRSMAMAKITQVGLPGAVEILAPLASRDAQPVPRARALWQLGRLGNLKYVNAAFSDPDPRFRILSMRILADFHGLTPSDYIPDWKEALLNDPSAAVRREALLLMRGEDAAKVKPLFYDLARKWDGKDRFYLCALGICAGLERSRRDAILADFDKQFREWGVATGGLLWELRPPMALAMMQQRLAGPKLTAAQQLQIVKTLAIAQDPAAGRVLLKELERGLPEAAAREALGLLKSNLTDKWTSLRGSDELAAAVKKLLAEPATRVQGIELMAASLKQELLAPVQGYALSESEAPAVRLAAAKTIGLFKKDEVAAEAIIKMIAADKTKTQDTTLDGLMALGKLNHASASDYLHTAAADAKTFSLPCRQTSVASLAQTRDGSAWLIKTFGQKKLDGDLTADLSRLLRNSPYRDLRTEALALFPPPQALDPKSLPSIPALVARKGSIERGQKLMAASSKNDMQCLKCHTINGVGGQVGPDLSTIGSKASRENLLESILYPSRAIADQYQQYLVETKKGLVVNAIVIEETPQHLLVRDANAKDYKFDHSEIDSKKKVPTSLMPELIRYISEQDLVDLVDYMASLKSAPIGAQSPATTVPLNIPRLRR